MNISPLRNAALAGLLALGLALPALAQDLHVNPDDVKAPKPEHSPYLEHNYPDRVFWGDTHVHTSYPTDAGMNSIGTLLLTGYGKDPNFNPQERAFYYVRVIEIPAPRWTTYDAKVFGVKLPEGVPPSIQERAYTSPIWYTPGT
jgi:hypothetical protein